MKPTKPDGGNSTGLDANGIDTQAEPDAACARDQASGLRKANERLLSLIERERRALARVLHDDVGQAMTAIRFCAQALRHASSEGDRQAGLDEIAQLAGHSISRLRELSAGIWPPQLDTLGFEAALRWQVGELFRDRGEEVELRLDASGQRATADIELAMFRIAQECLVNVIRHAGASRVEVRLYIDGLRLLLEIRDDGCGMVDAIREGGGIAIMRLRAQIAGGELYIEPGRLSGTRVLASFPWPQPEE